LAGTLVERTYACAHERCALDLFQLFFLGRDLATYVVDVRA
jgi:hypothetical protein